MGYYFLALGTAFSLFAIWAFVSRIKLLLVASRSQGVIVGFDEQLRHVGQVKKIYYHPVIEFETAEGHRHVFTYGGGSTVNRRQIGDSIEVLYDPSAPQGATVNSFMGTWTGPLAVTILGGGCLYAGIQLLLENGS